LLPGSPAIDVASFLGVIQDQREGRRRHCHRGSRLDLRRGLRLRNHPSRSIGYAERLVEAAPWDAAARALLEELRARPEASL